MITDNELNTRLERSPAPRVTPEMLDAVIAERTFYVHNLLTVCVLDLVNGFTVTGESACASPENYNREIGEKIAYDMARNKIWALEGYLLKSKLALLETATPPSGIGMTTCIGTKVIHAEPMSRDDYNTFRGWPTPPDEDGTDQGYLVEYGDGGKPNVEGWTGYVSWSPKDVFERAYTAI